MKKVVQIPFVGFYESHLSQAVDNAIELYSDDEIEKLQSFTFNDGNGEKIARDYVEFIAELLQIDMEFHALQSPVTYNFETDKVYAEIDTTELPLFDDDEYMRGWLIRESKSRYTSRDGYISFIEPDITPMFNKPYSEWEDCYLDLVIDYMLVEETHADIFLVSKLAEDYLESHNGHEFISNLVGESL